MIDEPRLTVREMKRRDWWLLADCLPKEEACNELQRAVLWFAWGLGWLGPHSKTGRKYFRVILKGLTGGPYQVGPFRVERAGRWGIAFALDPLYAAQRKPRRRRSREQRSGAGGWDGMFEGLQEQETLRRFSAPPDDPFADRKFLPSLRSAYAAGVATPCRRGGDSGGGGTTDGIRLGINEMRAEDWAMLAESLPMFRGGWNAVRVVPKAARLLRLRTQPGR